MERFSVLVIGCGAIAGGYDADDPTGPNILTHAKAFKTHTAFDLAGCVDLNLKAAQDFAVLWDVDRAYDSLDQALADRNFDIISLCTSTASHDSILRQLQACDVKLILCEKPITDRLDTAREIAALYKDRMAVNYLRRFDPKIRQLARHIKDGIYGKLLSGKAIYNKGLYNNGSHMTDLIHMLAGPVQAIEGGNEISDFWPDDPTLSARLETKTGAVIEMIGTDVRDGMTFDLSLEFETAQIALTDFSHKLTIHPKEGAKQTITTDLNRGMYHVASNIYDHLTGGAALCSTPENAVPALETCADIRKLAGL
ncbi:MAG: Gfo/Idh/MocA family oxidoreductase [Emcibacter sp.]|nr:Gfo/Idh/MocA family oxidoreductase [Emcibacter sp.]